MDLDSTRIGDYIPSKKGKMLVVLALVTGLTHLYVGISTDYQTLTLAGLGFLGGISLFFSGKFQNLVVSASVPYTALQFVFYYQTYGFSFSPIAGFDKIVQTAFIITAASYLISNYKRSDSLESFVKS